MREKIVEGGSVEPVAYARADLAWYVCGPMTNIPRFNYPLFDIVTLDLRRNTREVVSPTELDSKEMQERARASLTGNFADFADLGESWGDILARDVKLIERKIGFFALLPGWERSRGARLEVFVGLLVGVKSFNLVTFGSDGSVHLTERTVDYIRQCIREYMP